MGFLLTSEESELLLAFEKTGCIDGTAKLLHKDPSGVSRQISGISKKAPVLEKRGGRWSMTEVGRAFNTLARNVIQTQQRLLENRPLLLIGSNREFGARVVGPQLSDLQSALPRTQLGIFTYENGTEDALLKGRIDVGLDCGRPFDPTIAYKQVLPEPIVVTCSPGFRRSHESSIKAKRFDRLPHLLCERLYPDRILSLQENKMNVAASFNDIATARAACLAGVGWALLPRYAVKNELQSGSLLALEERRCPDAHYGVWWSRARALAPETLSSLIQWLKKQKL